MALRAATALFALAVASVSASVITEDVEAAESAKKAAEFTSLSAGGLATLTDANFDRLVRSPNRNYHVFVLFNARGDQYQCAQCGPFEDEVEVLAISYWRQKASDSEGKIPVMFFARADFSANRQVFQQYNLQSVPMLVHFSPTGSSPHAKNKLPAASQFVSESDAENAAIFVREKTEFKVNVYRSPLPAILTLVTLASVLGGVGWLLHSRVPAIIAWLRAATWIWLLACVGVYYIAVSGFLYDIIRGVPMFGFDPKSRRLLIFSNQAGTQYGIEGFIVGGFNVGACIALAALSRVVPKIRDQGHRTVWALAAVSVFAFCFMQVIALYRFKNPWYTPFRLTSSGM